MRERKEGGRFRVRESNREKGRREIENERDRKRKEGDREQGR